VLGWYSTHVFQRGSLEFADWSSVQFMYCEQVFSPLTFVTDILAMVCDGMRTFRKPCPGRWRHGFFVVAGHQKSLQNLSTCVYILDVFVQRSVLLALDAVYLLPSVKSGFPSVVHWVVNGDVLTTSIDNIWNSFPD